MSGIVIVGAGHAGVQLADSLRGQGCTDQITLLDADNQLPYQRPPLSKDFMAEDSGTALPLRGDTFYRDNLIRLLPGFTVAGIDRHRRRVHGSDGRDIGYSTLVLATGARHRELPVAGADLRGVHHLRTLSGARRIQEALAGAERAVVVGAGFIGLEFAAAARSRGLDVTVLDTADRPLARAVTPELSAHLTDVHRNRGIDLLLGRGVASFEGDQGEITAVRDSAGDRHPADLVLCGTGVLPNVELASKAGLTVADGIVVDDQLRTSDQHVHAIGDCARLQDPRWGSIRLEAVQNATEQARHLARVLLGQDPRGYTNVPWFWSQQGNLRIQIVGLRQGAERVVLRGDPESGRFSLYSFGDRALVCVESVNSPADHMGARKLLERRLEISPEQVRDPDFDLKGLARTAALAGSAG